MVDGDRAIVWVVIQQSPPPHTHTTLPTYLSHFCHPYSPTLTTTSWEANTGFIRRRISGHEDVVYRCLFTPEGNVISCSHDKRVMVWQLEEGVPAEPTNLEVVDVGKHCRFREEQYIVSHHPRSLRLPCLCFFPPLPSPNPIILSDTPSPIPRRVAKVGSSTRVWTPDSRLSHRVCHR